MGGLSACAAFDVLFLVQGRTGYLVLAALAVLFLFRDCAGAECSRPLVLVAAASAAPTSFSSLPSRVSWWSGGVSQWQPGVADEGRVGERLEFYRNTLAIIRDHPLLGVGTGGFAPAYAQSVQGTAMLPTRNPHNQYLLTASQLGLVGLGVAAVAVRAAVALLRRACRRDTTELWRAAWC